jgi:phosphatidylglycerol lysyltransferase
MRQRLARAAAVLLPVALLAAAAWAIDRELEGTTFRELEGAISDLPRAALALAALVTALDYLLLSGHDLLALRYAGRRVPLPRVVFTSFVAYAFGNNVGLSLLSSGSVRFRLYSQFGLSALDVTRVVAFTSAQLWAGLLPLAGVALLAGPPGPLPPPAARAAGIVCLALTAGYLLAAARVRRELRARAASASGCPPSRSRPGRSSCRRPTGRSRRSCSTCSSPAARRRSRRCSGCSSRPRSPGSPPRCRAGSGCSSR